jgi:Tfp pilus assembly protein PilF
MNSPLEYAKEYFQAGLIFFENGEYEQAKLELLKAYELLPERPSILANLSATLVHLREWEQAQNICEKLLAIEPQDSIGWLNLGVCAAHQEQTHFAIECFDKCLQIDPNSVGALANKANAHQDLEEFEAAESCYKKALVLNPHYEEALIGSGNLLNELKRYDAALDQFDQAIKINPHNHLAKWNKALSLLRLGKFAEGWPLFESRWQVPGMKEHRPKLKAPLWLGHESLDNKTIYVYAEQGYGDAIQFSRYLPMLESEKNARVILGSPKPLVALMKSLSPSIEVVDQKTFSEHQFPKQIDFQCPIMSLALAFDTTLDSIPNSTPYLFVEPSKQEYWAKRLLPSSNKNSNPFKVGITWRGSGKYANKASQKRDVPFNLIEEFIIQLSSRDIEFHTLQVEFGQDTNFQAPNIEGLKTYIQELVDFSDTAALISQLDLIVSVDTACAHLAGALGMPTLLLTPDPPDFMSLIDCDTSPWYPNTTLLRQVSRNDWSSPLAMAREKILLAAKNPISSN